MKKKVGIVGLGLIGGSFAKATTAYTDFEVYGLDINEEIVKRAIDESTINKELETSNTVEMDLMLLAVRPGVAKKYIEENPIIRGIVIDLCGVKRDVTETILPISLKNQFTYIGGHPMAGREIGGYNNSSKDLYKGASMILVPHQNDVPEWISQYLYEIGFSNIKISTDEEHDKIIAYTSQLAHVVSNAFVKSKAAVDHFGYSADSLKDLTRVATLDSEMWTELFFKNSDNLISEINGLIKELEKYKYALEISDEKELKQLLDSGVVAKQMMYPKEGN